MATFGARLKAARGKMTRKEAGDRLDIHPNTLKRYEDDERMPPSDLVVRIGKLYGVDQQWLLEEKGDSPASWAGEAPAAFRRDELSAIGEGEMVDVPVFDIRASAGNGGPEVHNEEPISIATLPRKFLLAHGVNPKSAEMGYADGDSMEPKISDGDAIVWDRSDQQPRDKIFLLRRGGALMIKRLQRRSDGALLLISENAAYAAEVLPRDEAESLDIIGRVGIVLRSI